MKKRKLVLVFNDVERVHLVKDVFLVPYYLGKRLDMEVSIVYPPTETNVDLPSSHRGVKLIRLPKGRYPITASLWLMKYAKEIDILMQFHFRNRVTLTTFVYKFFNPKGVVYCKSDGLFCFEPFISIPKSPLLKFLYRNYMRSVNCISFELKDALYMAQTKSFMGLSLKDKAVYMPNGFDEEDFQQSGVRERAFSEKENLMITIGRLGTYQKDTEMLLDAVADIDLKDWKIMLVGSIEEKFKSKIEAFYQMHPEKRYSVVFTGPVYDRNLLYDLYSRSKVFLLTSRFESYAIVLGEARRFSNYLVSTPVGCMSDRIHDKEQGSFVEIENSESLTSVVEDIINGHLDISKVSNDNLSWNELVKAIRLPGFN